MFSALVAGSQVLRGTQRQLDRAGGGYLDIVAGQGMADLSAGPVNGINIRMPASAPSVAVPGSALGTPLRQGQFQAMTAMLSSPPFGLCGIPVSSFAVGRLAILKHGAQRL